MLFTMAGPSPVPGAAPVGENRIKAVIARLRPKGSPLLCLLGVTVSVMGPGCCFYIYGKFQLSERMASMGFCFWSLRTA